MRTSVFFLCTGSNPRTGQLHGSAGRSTSSEPSAVIGFEAPFYGDEAFPEDRALHDVTVSRKTGEKGRTNWSRRAAFPFMSMPGISSDTVSA